MEVFIDNETRNTKNTHLNKPYPQTWKNNEICGNEKFRNTLLSIIGGDMIFKYFTVG
jgi:hypothetical protein